MPPLVGQRSPRRFNMSIIGGVVVGLREPLRLQKSPRPVAPLDAALLPVFFGERSLHHCPEQPVEAEKIAEAIQKSLENDFL